MAQHTIAPRTTLFQCSPLLACTILAAHQLASPHLPSGLNHEPMGVIFKMQRTLKGWHQHHHERVEIWWRDVMHSPPNLARHQRSTNWPMRCECERRCTATTTAAPAGLPFTLLSLQPWLGQCSSSSCTAWAIWRRCQRPPCLHNWAPLVLQL